MTIIVAIGIVVGAVCQLAMYFRRMPLWGDECALILNVVGKSGRALCFGRLDLAGPQQTQAAPPLFLLAMRGLALHFGQANEYAMRIIPLISALVAMPLFAAIVWKLFGPRIAAVLVPVLALSMRFTEHAATAKQYSSDLLIALVLLATAMRWRRESVAVRIVRTSLVAAASFWFSYTSVFVYAAMSLWLLSELRGTDRRTRATWAVGNLLAISSFLVLYVFCIRAQQDQFLHAYWAEAFPDYAHPARALLWLPNRLWDQFAYLQQPTGVLLLPVAIMGAIFLCRTRVGVFIALVGPIAAAALAAMAGFYPFAAKRVSLYLFPSEYLLAAAGLRWMHLSLRGRWRYAWMLPALIIIGVGLYEESRWLIAPRPQSYLRPAVTYLRSHRQANEPIYVIGRTTTTFLVYWGSTDAGIHLDVDPGASINEKRFWVIEKIDARDAKARTLAGATAKHLQEQRNEGSLVELCEVETPSPR